MRGVTGAMIDRHGIEALMDAQGLAPATIRQRLRVYDALTRDGRALDELDPVDVAAVIGRGRTGASRQTYRSHVSCLYRALRALGRDAPDPLEALPRSRMPRRQPRPLTRPEIARLRLGLPEPVRSWLTLALYAGLRCCEVARVQGSDLELHASGWRLRVRGKGGTDVAIPAHPRVVELLAEHGDGPLWPGLTAARVSDRARRAFARVGVDGGLHRARASFATAALRSSGGNLIVVRDLLRHASVVTTQRYVGVDDDESSGAVMMLDI